MNHFPYPAKNANQVVTSSLKKPSDRVRPRLSRMQAYHFRRAWIFLVPVEMTAMHLQRSSGASGSTGMRPSEQYRQFAEDCLRLASRVNNGNHRLVLEEMAEAWSSLAEEAEEEDGQV